jgi:cytochrome P450
MAQTAMVEEVVDFDPFGKRFRSDPMGCIPELLAHSPGFIRPEGVPSAYVAQYDQVSKILSDFHRFSSLKPKGLPGMERVDFFNSQPVMNYSDRPEHTRLRKVVSAAFSPRSAMAMAAATRAIANDLLDAIHPGETLDVVEAISSPFARRLMLDHFIGIPPEDWSVFTNLSAALRLLDAVPPGGGKPKGYLDAWEAGARYAGEALDRLRHDRKDNLLNVILNAHDSEGRLSDDEMLAMIMVMFIGGTPALTGTSAAALVRLAQRPDLGDRLRADPAAASLLYEESLRIEPTTMLVMRFAMEDVDIGDATIRKGMPVYVMNSAANFDTSVFPDPLRFDIDRENLKAHFSFGFGLHACIGNNMVRAAAPLLIHAVAQRFPGLRLADPANIVYDTTPRSRHISSAQLAF